jgi:hypothetical protein
MSPAGPDSLRVTPFTSIIRREDKNVDQYIFVLSALIPGSREAIWEGKTDTGESGFACGILSPREIKCCFPILNVQVEWLAGITVGVIIGD